MIRDESELLALVSRLQRAEQAGTGFFAKHSLPEYTAVDELDLTATEAARFLTLSLVPFHAHSSGQSKPQVGRAGLWRVCRNLWQQHRWVYDPHRLVTVDIEDHDDRTTIQTFWDVFCEKHTLVPCRVEKPLRVVGLYWHRGGQDYVASVLEAYR